MLQIRSMARKVLAHARKRGILLVLCVVCLELYGQILYKGLENASLPHDDSLKVGEREVNEENVYRGLESVQQSNKPKLYEGHVSEKRGRKREMNVKGSGKVLSYQGITYTAPDCRRKSLVYTCLQGTNCGGLADRQKGLLSTFILSLLTNRTFIIDDMPSCNFEEVLPPNLYDWTKCRGNIQKYKDDTLNMQHIFIQVPEDFNALMSRYNGSDLWNEQVVKWRVNKRYQKRMKKLENVTRDLPWLISKPEEDITQHTMELLFKHSEQLSKSVRTFVDSHFGHRYVVCAHFRFGLGRDGTFLTMNESEIMLHLLASHIDQLKKPYTLYVASDSNEAKCMMKRSFPDAVSLNITVEHVDQTGGTSCTATFNTVLEQTILSHCDTLLSTGSGFSRMAALIGGRAKRIFACEQYRNCLVSLMFGELFHQRFVNDHLLHDDSLMIGVRNKNGENTIRSGSTPILNDLNIVPIQSVQYFQHIVNIHTSENEHSQDIRSEYGSHGPEKPARQKETKNIGNGNVLSYQGITYTAPDCRRKSLVYTCNGPYFCGGLADRQKGIMSTFILAMLTNRTFIIDDMPPCNYEEVLPPNLYDWTKCRGNIQKYEGDTLIMNHNNGEEKFETMISSFNGSDLWSEAVVKWRVNRRLHKIMKKFDNETHVLPWLISKPDEDLTQHTTELLFKQSELLSKTVRTFLDDHCKNRYLVCAHFRVGLGKDRKFLTPNQIKKLLDFLASYLQGLKKEYTLYVASDSYEAKLMAKRSFPDVITLNITVGHMDRTNDSTCSTTFTSVLEQTILSQCETILSSGSGYSRQAIMYGGKAKHIFMCHQYAYEKEILYYSRHTLAEAHGV